MIHRHRVEAIDLQEIGAELHVFGEIDHTGMRDFNPSVTWHEGKLMISLRRCNFAVERLGKWFFRDGSAYSKTDVLYGYLNPDTLKPFGMKKLTLSEDSPKEILTAGLEDVRLFSREDGMHAIGFQSDRLSRTLHNESANMAEYLIERNKLKYLRTLDKPDPKVVEKNWMPTDVPTKEFDFTYSDIQVWKDGEILGEPSLTQIHGGTQLVKQNDGTYLSLVHEKIKDRRYGVAYDSFVYYTYLAKHGKDGIITELSKPFRFGTQENIEFASGMDEYGDELLITLGIRDCKWAICRINKEKLKSLFNKEEMSR